MHGMKLGRPGHRVLRVAMLAAGTIAAVPGAWAQKDSDAALRELMARIQALEARNAALEQQVQAFCRPRRR